VFNHDEQERALYEARLKAQRDHSSLMREVREAREAEGRARDEGRKEGRKEGALVGQVRLCQELLKQPQTPEAELAALPRAALADLLAQLRKQLSPTGE
jgi:hypothetical protein